MNKIPVLLVNVIVSAVVFALLLYSNELRQQPTTPSQAWYADTKTIHQLAFLITLFQVYFLVGMVNSLHDRLDSVIAQALHAQRPGLSSALSSIVAPGTLLTANRIDAPADAKELTVIFDGLAFDFVTMPGKTSVGITVEAAATFGKPDTPSTDVFVDKRTLKVHSA